MKKTIKITESKLRSLIIEGVKKALKKKKDKYEDFYKYESSDGKFKAGEYVLINCSRGLIIGEIENFNWDEYKNKEVCTLKYFDQNKREIWIMGVDPSELKKLNDYLQYSPIKIYVYPHEYPKDIKNIDLIFFHFNKIL